MMIVFVVIVIGSYRLILVLLCDAFAFVLASGSFLASVRIILVVVVVVVARRILVRVVVRLVVVVVALLWIAFALGSAPSA